MGLERLQKILARAGIASRRKAEELIRGGKVSVNGEIITELGQKADASLDMIRVDRKLIIIDAEKVYLMVHKPAGVLTSMKDDRERKVVAQLVQDVPERVFPVGRLDYHSEGLLLMTNDGEFAYRIAHPKFKVAKTYMVKIKGNIPPGGLKEIKIGISLSDGYFKPEEAVVERVNPKSTWLKFTIYEGKNRIIRRYLSAFGYTVLRLVRTAIADIELGELKPGAYRYLTKKEVQRLFGFVQKEAGEN